MRSLVTGGSGFIGSHLVRRLLGEGHEVINIDLLTYAGRKETVRDCEKFPNYHFVRADIVERELMRDIIRDFHPEAIFHLAAESHVDRSIDDPSNFIRTNIEGTFSLLEAVRGLKTDRPLFVHVSTDEVFGSLIDGKADESGVYAPSSPYSASKAAADQLVMAWAKTYELPLIITRSSNNFGPYQFPEKLIPLVILRALSGQKIPIFGDGEQIRDWLYVTDHVDALVTAMKKGTPGSNYNVAANQEFTNRQLVEKICRLLDSLHPAADGDSYRSLITHVPDRPGHDFRYAMDTGRLQNELGWRPRHTFSSALEETIRWYLGNAEWWQPLLAEDDPLRRRGIL